jgi:cobalt/nickel transport system permease protein
MFYSDFSDRKTPIHSIDPRVRIIVCFVFSIFLAIALTPFSILAVSSISVVFFFLSKIKFSEIKGRFAALNIFVIFLFLTSPFSGKKDAIFSVYGCAYSYEGFIFCCKIALRSNAILLLFTSLVNTVDIVSFAHALSHLKCPDKLVYLLLFTIRYIDVIHNEYLQLKKAMSVRGFKPGMNFHTYKSYANLAAILLVRSVDRSECVYAAMRCRCFKGRFHLLSHFYCSARDFFFLAGAFLILVCLIYGEFFWQIR